MLIRTAEVTDQYPDLQISLFCLYYIAFSCFVHYNEVGISIRRRFHSEQCPSPSVGIANVALPWLARLFFSLTAIVASLRAQLNLRFCCNITVSEAHLYSGTLCVSWHACRLQIECFRNKWFVFLQSIMY
jgi:hypothetical protein